MQRVFILHLWSILSEMRQFNRILGFVAVSFVLAFMGKVNKVGLYTVYFQTIADVEIRNSTGLDHGDVQYVAAAPSHEVQRLVESSGSGTGLLATANLSLAAFSVKSSLVQNAPQAPSFGLRCFMDVAPRAPGA